MEWPSIFPGATIESHGDTPIDPVVRTRMESGGDRARRRTASTLSNKSVRWIFNQTTYGIFEAFWHHTVSAGASWFSMDLRGAVGVSTYDVRFLGAYQAKPISHDRWEVVAQVEVRNIPMFSASEVLVIAENNLDVYLLISQSDLFDVLINQTLPEVGSDRALTLSQADLFDVFINQTLPEVGSDRALTLSQNTQYDTLINTTLSTIFN